MSPSNSNLLLLFQGLHSSNFGKIAINVTVVLFGFSSASEVKCQNNISDSHSLSLYTISCSLFPDYHFLRLAKIWDKSD